MYLLDHSRINNSNGPTAIATTTTDATCGSSNGTLTLGAVTGGVAPYTYSIDGGAFTGTTNYTNLAAGSRTIDVKDANGCIYSTTATVNGTNGPTAIVATTTDAACGSSNGTLTLGIVTGGVAPYEYSVDGSAFTTTTNYTNLAAGSHTIDVRDANGCIFSTTAGINNSNGPTAIVTTTTDATCGSSNGTLTLGAVTGGVAPYEYSVDGSAFTTTTNYTNLAAGSHTIDVRDANGCIYSTTATVNGSNGPTAIVTTTTDAACGSSNGTLTLGAVTGGVAPYEYSVDGSAFTTTTNYTNLAAGSHTIDVRDANGCIFSTTAGINNSNGPTAIVTTTTDATCGSSNGTLTLGAVTGGVAPYEYSVDGSAFTTTTNYTTLAAGSHTIDVRDANGCIYSTTATVNGSNGPTAIVTTTTDAACGSSNGTLTLGAVTGGVAPYEYSVDGSAFTTTTNYTTLAAGSHTIDVRDANGCIYSTTATVTGSNGPTAIATTTTDAACGASDGTLTLGAVTGGVAPYEYSVDGSAFTTTTNYTNLAAGSHTIDVRDANGCIFSTTAGINNSNGPTAIATTTTDATCGSSNGTLTLGAVTGGVAPYEYSVDGSAFTTTTNYTNLAAGSHTIDVRDANGCIYSTTATVTGSNGPTAIATTTTDAACGSSNGTLTLGAVTGGVAPYEYSVDGSAFTTTTNYTNLAAGSHTIDVRDANGCIFSTTAGINNSNGPTAIVTTTTDATCGSSNGTLTLGAVTGGVAPYEYSVDGSAFTTTTNYTNLAAGSHTIDVRDANGCIYSTTATVTGSNGPTAIATTTTDAACGASDGTLTLGAVTGGVAPYEYSVDGSAFTTTTNYTNLAAGSHTIDVRDANGCIFSTTAGINNSNGPTAIATTTTDATCGSSNGTLTLGAVTGGVAPYTYSIDGGAFTGTTNYTNLAAGSRTIDVKDANGCIFSTTATVNGSNGPTAIATTTTDAACGSSNGTLTLGAVTGGVAPYEYSVDGSAFTTTTNYTNLAAGSHTIDVRDANGCIFSTTAGINNSNGPTAIATTTTDATCGSSNGTLTLGAVTGGVAPYEYSVDGGAFTTTTNYTNLAAGSHTIDVRDANGCIYSTTATVTGSNGPTAIATTTTDAACGSSNGTLTLGAVTGGVAPYEYSVDGSAFTTTTNYTNLAAGSHTIDVRDANGCIFSTTAGINNSNGPTAIVTTTTDATCGSSNGTLTLGAVTGGVAPYEYSVDGSAFTTTTNYTNLAAGSHTIDVRDANGCIYSTTATVTGSNGPTAIATTTTDAACGASDGTLTLGAVTGGVAPYEYSVDGSAFTTTTNYTTLAAGSHTIDVRDANGCIYSTTATVTGSNGPTAIATTTTDAACGASDGILTLGVVTGGVAPYEYSVDGSAFTTTTNYTNLAAGSHTIDVRDANGCIFSTTAGINNSNGPTAIATTTTDATCGSSNGTLTLGAVTGGVAPYEYSVDGSAFTTTTNYTNLAAGSHTIDVRDANGCIYSTTATVTGSNGPTAIATTTTDAACGASDGILTLGAVTGGVAPYEYSVDGSAFTTTTNYTNLAAGSHTIDVRDANGCIFSTTAGINNSNGPTAIATTTTDATCGSSNGTLTLGAVTGGVAPYEYSVDGSAFTTTTNYTNLAAGSHTIDVRDANGCIYSTTATVTGSNGPTAIATTTTDAACGASDGTLTLGAVTGGVAPYEYSVDGSAFTTTTNYTNLAAGSHTIDVRDANGCIFSTTAGINNTNGPTAIVTTTTDASCGTDNGTLALGTVTGGVAPYEYSVDGGVFTTTTNYTNLAAGSHTIDVRDANGCIYATTAGINSATPPTLAITDPLTVCAPNTIDLTAASVTAGSDPGLNLTYWLDANATTPIVSPNAVATGGTFYIKATSAAGCSIVKPVLVTINTGPALMSLLLTRHKCVNRRQWISLIQTLPLAVIRD